MHECMHSSRQGEIPLWLSVIRRAFCSVAVHLHETNFLQYSRRIFCGATMYIYDDSTALEPLLLNVRLGSVAYAENFRGGVKA